MARSPTQYVSTRQKSTDRVLSVTASGYRRDRSRPTVLAWIARRSSGNTSKRCRLSTTATVV